MSVTIAEPVSRNVRPIRQLNIFVIKIEIHFFVVAEVVLQTRRRKVPVKYLEKAYGVIKDDGLPLHDLVCQGGF